MASQIELSGPRGLGLVAGARRYLRDDMPVLAAGGAICALYAACLWSLGLIAPNFATYSAYSQFFAWGLAVLLAGRLGMSIVRQPAAPLSEFAADLRQRAGRIVAGVPMVLLVAVFMTLFGAVKSAIPLLHPFAWDAWLMHADAALFGTDPWRLLQPVLGFPQVTSLIALLYKLWLGILFCGSWYFAAFVDDRTLRTRYLLAFFASWFVIGTVMAVALSSVGPVFAGPILGLHRYDPQVAYLTAANASVPNLAFFAQQYLLAAYQSGQPGIGVGISAMPSMHVSLACLCGLAMRRAAPATARAFGAFVILIAVGSVHLGYHYALDGMVGALCVWLIWRACEPIARRITAR